MQEETKSGTSRKQKNKASGKFGKIAIIVLAAIALLAGYTLFVVKYTQSKTPEVQTTDSEILKEDAISYLSQEHSPDEISETLTSILGKMDTKNATDVVDMYIKGTYNAAMQYIISDDETNKLYHAMDMNNHIVLSDIEDEDLQNKVKKLDEQHIVLRYVNGDLFYDVDYGWFYDTFKDYIIPDYAAMLAFYDEEKNTDYYDPTNDMLYAEVIEDRLDQLYSMKSKYPDSDLMDIYEEAYDFYKLVYFGGYAQDYIFENGSVRPEMVDRYRQYSSSCRDPKLKAFLEELLKQYEHSNNVRTVSIFKKIQEFCNIDTTEGTSSL